MFDVFINDGNKEMPESDICYIVGKEGVFLKKKLGIMDSIAPVKKISFLKSVSATAKMHIPKLPAVSFAKVIEFFKAVYQEYWGECIVLLFYNEETQKFRIVPPKQEVSAGGLDYDRKMTLEGYTMIGDIHSHARMSAFHSGIDDDDENSFDGLHITIGDLDEDEVSLSASIVANGYRMMVSPFDYISGIRLTKEIDEEETGYTTKVYKWDPKSHEMILDTEASKKSAYTYRKYDKRYISTVSPSKREFNQAWMALVEKKTYVWPGYAKTGKYSSGYNYHYDAYAWNQFRKVGTKPPLPPIASGTKVSPLNVGPKVTGITFPKHEDVKDKVPCLTCKHKHCKLELEDEDLLDEDFYQCEKCKIIISPGSDTIICPNCKSDEHLTLIDEKEMVDYYTEESIAAAQEMQPDQEGKKVCLNCFNTFTKLETDINCPYCKCLLAEYESSEDELERQTFSDAGAFLDPIMDDVNEEAIRQATVVEKIADPTKPEIPINDKTDWKEKFRRVFARGGNA